MGDGKDEGLAVTADQDERGRWWVLESHNHTIAGPFQNSEGAWRWIDMSSGN